ncbi:MAG: peroxiredoxin-like family protein [Armatimonadota bacterium]
MVTTLATLILTQTGVAMSADAAKPLQNGAKAPMVKLNDIDGKSRDLKSILSGKPTVVVFYRGGWCPFCNAQLAELGQNMAAIQAKGYNLIGISPDLPANLKATIGKNKLEYPLYSDAKAEALRKFGIAFKVDGLTFTTYKEKYKLDLEKWSGENHHILPVPSVYVIDAKGTIKFSYSNPDYRVRLKANALLAAL